MERIGMTAETTTAETTTTTEINNDNNNNNNSIHHRYWQLGLLPGSAVMRDVMEEQLAVWLKEKAGIRRIVITHPAKYAELALAHNRDEPISIQIAHKRTSSKPPIKFNVSYDTIIEDLERLKKTVTDDLGFGEDVASGLSTAMMLYLAEMNEEGNMMILFDIFQKELRAGHIEAHEKDECPCGYAIEDVKTAPCAPINASYLLRFSNSITRDYLNGDKDVPFYFTPETLFATLGRLVDKRYIREVPFSPIYTSSHYRFRDPGGYYILTPLGADAIQEITKEEGE